MDAESAFVGGKSAFFGLQNFVTALKNNVHKQRTASKSIERATTVVYYLLLIIMEVSAFQDFLGLNSETYDELACWQELFSSLADSDCTSSPAHSDNSSHFATDDEDFRRPSASSLTDYDCSCLTEMLSTNQKKRKYEAVGGDRFQIFDSASTQEPSRGIRKVSDPRLTVEKLIECLNSSNVAALTSLIQAHTADDILLISPDVRDPCLGQKDLILHFSFLMEAFPDGLWQIESIGSDVLDDDNDEGIKLTFLLKFRGTKVFTEPLEKVFRQLRSQVGKRPVGALH
eukprot:gene25711-31048_t